MSRTLASVWRHCRPPRISGNGRVVSSAGAWLATVVVVSMVVGALNARTTRLATRLAERSAELESVQGWATEYHALRASLATEAPAENRAPASRATSPPSLWTVVESAARTAVSEGSVAAMTPNRGADGADDISVQEESIELRLRGTTLAQLVDLLYRLEHGAAAAHVGRLDVKRAAGMNHAVDATLAVMRRTPAR
jgi:hypothetical protein